MKLYRLGGFYHVGSEYVILIHIFVIIDLIMSMNEEYLILTLTHH